MVNAIGGSDNFIANGKTAVWNSKGELLEMLNSKHEGLLIYNSETDQTIKQYLTI